MRTHNSEQLSYLSSLLPEESPYAKKAKLAAQSFNKDGISLSLYEAHILGFFIRLFRCKTFVEIGTLTGYSGLKILENLDKDGYLWTLELDPQHAAAADELFKEAGYDNRYSLLVGKAEEQLALMAPSQPFDGVFIDANKAAYPFYLDWALTAIRPGGLIIADNTLMRGVVPTESSNKEEKMIARLREFNQKLSNQNLFDSIVLPTAEGLSIAIKK